MLQLRLMVRPELFSYTFSIVALMLYFRSKNTLSVGSILPMVLLMWIWTSYHSSIIGYVIFLGFFLDVAVDQFKSKASLGVWTKWLLWGLLIVAVGFINPGLSHPVLQALTFPEEWKTSIMEYRTPEQFVGFHPSASWPGLYWSTSQC